MTRRIDTGSGVRRTALNLADTCVSNAKHIATLVDEVLDNQPENITALRALNELSRNNMSAFDVLGKVADGKFSEAELTSEGMNLPPKKDGKKGQAKDAVSALRNGVKR